MHRESADDPEVIQQADFLDRRLALAPHYAAHPQDAERVLLLSEERSFRLRGQIYRELLPWLDGARTGRQIAEAFRGKLADGEVEAVLAGLLEEGYVVVLPEGSARHLTAYWTAQGLSPLAADRRLKAVSLGVLPLGDGAAAGVEGAAALLALLAGSGLLVTDEARAD